MVPEPQRLELLQALQQSIGTGPAATLMTLLPPADIARRSDIDNLDARIDKLDARIDKLDARIERLEGRVDSLAIRLDARIDGLEMKIDAQLSRFILAALPMMFGTAGLVLAAARFG